jgi:hypothetical protein
LNIPASEEIKGGIFMSKNRNKDTKQNQPAQDDSGVYTFRDYFYINLIFWGFLTVVAVAVFFSTGAKMDPVIENVFTFIYMVFGLGFTAVSIFDALYEKVAGQNKNEK